MARNRNLGIRLSGGEHGGRILKAPAGSRPTVGRVREALLSIWGPEVERARVLELFAGSGAVALEAVGRGALSALCVEASPPALEVLERNVRDLGEEGVVEVRRGVLPEALGELAAEGRRFDLAFADPPYAFSEYPQLLAAAAALLARHGELVVEHSARRDLPLELEVAERGEGEGGEARPATLVRVDVRRYGESALSFYRLGPD